MTKHLFITEAQISGFLTDGKLDNSKFRAFYNLSNSVDDEKEKENDEFASSATVVIKKYTKIFKDYENSEKMKDLEVISKKIIKKFKSTIDCNSYSVKYFIVSLT